MVRLRLGRKTTWDKIKIGEVFVEEGCLIIGIKTSSNSFRILAYDYSENFGASYNLISKIKIPNEWEQAIDFNRYKLPLETQQLWRTD